VVASGVGVGLGSAKSERLIANANTMTQMTTLIITGSTEDTPVKNWRNLSGNVN
jgi:hypothetical protein